MNNFYYQVNPVFWGQLKMLHIENSEQYPGFHAPISELNAIAGVGGTLNTSFNFHGEPIVRSAKGADRLFELTDIDDLWVGEVLISKTFCFSESGLLN
ncbi:MAG: carbamoyltransferase C-terminal domain-containing protein [Burkholderiales bacterium]|nr:carbamoyltransferase C-terminal domain-containing protein [Burkholderiales bacterium]